MICYIAYSSTIVATLSVDVDQLTSFRGLIKMGYQVMFHDDQAFIFAEPLVTFEIQ